MHFKGVELTKPKAVKYCSDNTCTNLIPICSLFITPECSDNPTKWHHITAGEHVCSICYNYLYSFFSYENENREINEWKQAWLTQSHENPTIYDYITSRLLSNWYSCCQCGKWRQVNRDIILSPLEIQRFCCGSILEHSRNPCGVVEDQRIEFIKIHPGSFFDSVKYSVYLATTPYMYVYDEYSLDTVGVSPVADGNLDFDIGVPCQGFMNAFNPFARSIDSLRNGAGSIDPASMDKWEYEYFPTFTGNMRPVFIGLRNLMMLLWAAEPKRPITMQLLERCVFLRGLARVALLVNSVPDMIRIYGAFAFINFGFPVGPTSVQGDLAKMEDSAEETLVSIPSTIATVVVIGAGLSGLSAARHLSLMGNRVIVLETTMPTSGADQPMMLDKLRMVTDSLGEVYGSLNNPLSVMAHQLNIDMKPVNTNLSIFDSRGELVPDSTDQLCQDLVYNFVAHLLECSATIDTNSTQSDSTLYDVYQQYRQIHLPRMSSCQNSDDNENESRTMEDLEAVEHVYLSEIEYRLCGGASMSQVLPADIDFLCPTVIESGPCSAEVPCNFSFRNQFSGPTTEPIGTWQSMVTAMVTAGPVAISGSIEIRYGTRVVSVSATTSSINNPLTCDGSNSVTLSTTTIPVTKWKIETNCVIKDAEFVTMDSDKVVIATSPWNIAHIEFHDHPDTGDDVITISGHDDQKVYSNSLIDHPGDPFFVIQLIYAPQDRYWHDRLCIETVFTTPVGKESNYVFKRDISFAITPSDMVSRGFCHMFKEEEELESVINNGVTETIVVKSVLYTHIFGLAARECTSLTNQQIVDRVLAKLAPLCRRSSDQVPSPLRYEVSRVDNALWPSTEWGRRHRHVRVADRHQTSLSVTNKVQWLAEPVSLSSSVCAGIEAAACLARHMV